MMNNIEEDQIQTYIQFIEYFLNVQMINSILMLPQDKKNVFFDLIEKNADLFSDIMMRNSNPILDHVKGIAIDKELLNDHSRQFIEEFDNWKETS